MSELTTSLGCSIFVRHHNRHSWRRDGRSAAGVKARPADEWKGRLREDVLERVRTNRVAILSRARGEGASGASLRDEVDMSSYARS